ncbi:ABC transporter substrate-binding protein [Rhizomicrobium electricum]|jgi:phospholipid transport system substrate-binding protein|uniref:ABC transporter substrate-binding protein n=2 Tax=Rhizomicrobium electricum TaxID=480070 RepID=A0ABP3QA80_9PROT
MRGMMRLKFFATSFSFVAALVLSLGLSMGRAEAASPAEQFIADNVQKAMGILNNTASSKEQKKTEFQNFLLGLTDIQSIGRYTLGQYRRSASPEDLTAFDAAFKDYAMSVYQSYFAKYSGQSLKVTGSNQLGANDIMVKTVTVDPKKPSAKPFEVNFRVQTVNGRMLVVDFSVEGVWIRELERNDFTSYLGQKNGDVKALVAMLKQKAAQQH